MGPTMVDDVELEETDSVDGVEPKEGSGGEDVQFQPEQP